MIWLLGILAWVGSVSLIIAFVYGAGLKDNESRK